MVGAFNGVGSFNSRQSRGSKKEQANIDDSGNAQRPQDIVASCAKKRSLVGTLNFRICVVVVDQGRVQVYRVRHDSCAEHRGSDQD